MNSLHENHRVEFSFDQMRTMQGQTCWELLQCARVLCPAHGKKLIDCWLTPKTHCCQFITDDFFLRLSSCLSCAYFKARGGIHQKGWNDFLVEQLHRYNINALERIYQKEESFVDVLNLLPYGLFTTNHEWRITYFNPAAEAITGFSAQDAMGMYCKDVFRNPICQHDCALKRSGAEGGDICNREYEITNLEGQKIPIFCSTSAFRDAAGRITGGLETFIDISHIKQLQEEIVRREKKYRRIFEGSHDMIFTTNLDGKIIDINWAGVDMLGYRTKRELLEQLKAADLYRNPADRERFLTRITREGFVKDYEAKFKKRDGSPIHVLISSRKYENSNSGAIEIEGIIKDITQRKQNVDIISQRSRELSIINSLAVDFNRTMELNPILKLTLEKVVKMLQLEQGGIFLLDREAKKFRLQASVHLPDSIAPEKDELMFMDELLMRNLLEETASLRSEATFPYFQVSYLAAGNLTAHRLTCFLINSKGRGVGFFGLVVPDSRELSLHELHLMGSLGNFLGGAIENTQMMGTIRRHRQELRQLTEKLFQSQEEERRRIARELHDEAGQSLTAVKLGLDRLEEKYASTKVLKEDISEIRMMITRTASEIRRLSYHLHPTLLSDLGLEPALSLFFLDIQKHSDLDIEFRMIGFDQRLDPDLETVLYRFSQETLTNALKHSGAECFRLSIIKSYPRIIFVAEDDGLGFDAEIIGKDKRSLGLLGMRERASLLNGTFHLRSSPGDGTRIRIEIPLDEESRHE